MYSTNTQPPIKETVPSDMAGTVEVEVGVSYDSVNKIIVVRVMNEATLQSKCKSRLLYECKLRFVDHPERQYSVTSNAPTFLLADDATSGPTFATLTARTVDATFNAASKEVATKQ